jgi:hypothetical protein
MRTGRLVVTRGRVTLEGGIVVIGACFRSYGQQLTIATDGDWRKWRITSLSDWKSLGSCDRKFCKNSAKGFSLSRTILVNLGVYIGPLSYLVEGKLESLFFSHQLDSTQYITTATYYATSLLYCNPFYCPLTMLPIIVRRAIFLKTIYLRAKTR